MFLSTWPANVTHNEIQNNDIRFLLRMYLFSALPVSHKAIFKQLKT